MSNRHLRIVPEPEETSLTEGPPVTVTRIDFDELIDRIMADPSPLYPHLVEDDE